ncbi:Transcription Elongation Factor A N-Terminal And Central Domain-Containing Protein 2 [Manis pentadactyla]|nr:Transcription Elongation Factor A N-Terminal And Central Domain-Containing Protein 2 [Manis pentadactyla]
MPRSQELILEIPAINLPHTLGQNISRLSLWVCGRLLLWNSKAGWGHVALPRPCWPQFLNPSLQRPAFPTHSISREAWTVGWEKPQRLPPGTRCPQPLGTCSGLWNSFKPTSKALEDCVLYVNRARFHIEQLQTGKSEKAQPSPRFRGACWGLSPPAREGRPCGRCLRPGPGCHGTRSRCPRAALRTARQIRAGAAQEHLPAAPPRPALP